ncbi:hypothetical protein GDO86_011979 [Hymenochirus boettgeri]|uniref:P2X purinoreceptor 7 intracellular domain-containing protein n=1 Tax=Hymenochirus boettgeri TaxID=247094 RepID=A0A8T2JJ95_9PIPI|nr:hypothetical protein GDO86_011979 [Hymenochirus boettgeri]
MEPQLSRFSGQVQIKTEEEEVHIGHLIPTENFAVPNTSRGYQEPEILQRKIKEEAPDSEYYANPMEGPSGQSTVAVKSEDEALANRGIKSEMDSVPVTVNPGIYRDHGAIRISASDSFSVACFEEAETESLNIKREEHESLVNSMDIVEVKIGDSGIASEGGDYTGLNGDPAALREARYKELLEQLKNRPEILNAPKECFQDNPRKIKKKKKKRKTKVDGQESESEDSSINFSDEETDRVGNVDWCQCGKCAPMESQIECTCCSEVHQIKEFIPQGASCITEHPEFITECTIYSRIDYTFRIINIDLKKKPKKTEYMRFLRKTAFRCFSVWIYGFLGSRGRKRIPTCVVNKVREVFPDPRGRYSGYLESHDYLAEQMAVC